MTDYHGGGVRAVRRPGGDVDVYLPDGTVQVIGSEAGEGNRNLSFKLAEAARAGAFGRTCPNELVPYSRLTDPAAKSTAEELTLLSQLGDLMAEAAARGDPRPSAFGLPAAYTYFGQLLAHDISDMRIGAQDWHCPLNLQTPALDFATVLSPPDEPSEEERPHLRFCGGIALGRLSDRDEYADLPRRADGQTLVKDRRCDSNLALAQMHVLLSRFHHHVCSVIPDEAEAERVTKHHLQWVVLHDYLKRVIDPLTWADVMANGPVLINRTDPFLPPIEFAAACFRLGHSMVRSEYVPWRHAEHENAFATTEQLAEFTAGGGRLDHQDGHARLNASWAAEWRVLLLGDPRRGAVAVEANAIGGALPAAFRHLPARLVETELTVKDGRLVLASGTEKSPEINLSKQTLLLGARLQLPSADTLHRWARNNLKIAGRSGLGRLIPKVNLAAVADPSLRDFLKAHISRTLPTPLWFYCLREAVILSNGQAFGPLAGRIVMETIHAAVARDADGILAGGRTFLPDRRIWDREEPFSLKSIALLAMGRS